MLNFIFRLSLKIIDKDLSKQLYLGGLCDSAEEFALPLKGDFSPFQDSCLKQMWKIEKCNEQIIPVQLSSRRPNSFQARKNSLLKWIALLIFYIEIKILIFIRRNSQKENFSRINFEDFTNLTLFDAFPQVLT